MTPSQRLRLVIALGAVNLVLAIAAFGLAGTMNEAPGTAIRTPAASASPGPVAAATPAPPSRTPPPTGTPGPSFGPTPAATELPGPTLGAVESSRPVATHIPVGTQAPAPTPRPSHPSPTPKPLPSPTPVPPVTNTDRGHPPCPGSIDGPPGKHKSTAGDDRPCRGGNGNGGAPGSGGHATSTASQHAALVVQAVSTLSVGLVEPKVRVVSRRRSRPVGGPRRSSIRGPRRSNLRH